MPQELLNIIWSAVALIVTSLITWGFFLLRSWVNKKIEDKEKAGLINDALTVVENCVKEVFQVFVEALKKENRFDKESQEKAKEMAIDMAINRIAPKAKAIVESYFGDLREWIANQIEITIYTLKQN